jgi:hypothetical protein
MKTITLSDDIHVTIDDDDFDRVAKINWVPVLCGKKTKKVYVMGWCKEKKRNFYMHRLLTMANSGQLVDHINGNPLDNRKANLRICTPTENCGNMRCNVGKSGFRGVEKTRSGKFRAYIQMHYKNMHLGVKETAEEAARLYDFAAIRHFGEFATLNFPVLRNQHAEA